MPSTWVHVKDSSADGREFGGAGRGDAFAVGVCQGAEFECDVAGVLDDDLVFDRLAGFAGDFAFGVVRFALDALELFDRVAGFFGDRDRDLVGGFGARAFVAFDRGFVAVGAHCGERVGAGEGGFGARREFAGAAGDQFAVGVGERAEFERDVAGVLDDDVVFDGLADFGAGDFAFRVGADAADALELFDREGRFFARTLTSTLLELSVSGKPMPIGGVPVTVAWLAYLPTVLAVCSHV